MLNILKDVYKDCIMCFIKKIHRKILMTFLPKRKEEFNLSLYNVYLLNFWQPVFSAFKSHDSKYSRKHSGFGSDWHNWYFPNL